MALFNFAAHFGSMTSPGIQGDESPEFWHCDESGTDWSFACVCPFGDGVLPSGGRPNGCCLKAVHDEARAFSEHKTQLCKAAMAANDAIAKAGP